MASPTGDDKPFSIQVRLYRERERLPGGGMTEKERAFRKQWLKDQHLSPNEPRHVPEIYKELYNPIRRTYWIQLDKLIKAMEPMMGQFQAQLWRRVTGKVLMGLALVYARTYYAKYKANDWTRKGGRRFVPNRPSVVPGEKNYPYVPERSKGVDYASREFAAQASHRNYHT